MNVCVLTCLFIACGALALFSEHTWAEAAQLAAAPKNPTRDLNRPDLEAWLDGFIPYALQQGDIAGAVIVVVRNEDVLLQKGYGYADREKGIPVDPERTLFRPGSISKLFTSTAVMQLVEAGRLDLDADVNSYLDFRVPPKDGKPVTLRNLLTHTAGFEESLKSIFSAHEAGLIPLDRFTRDALPAQIFPAGEIPAYSNYGSGLAGYIVQRVTGQPFEAYVEHHIFAPLGMTRSTFRQPLPDELAATMSKGYALASDASHGFEFVNPAPAGALSAVGTDIGRFMIAQLNEGAAGDARILAPETTRSMHATAFRVTPSINGMSLGFFELDRNGYRVLGHSGDLSHFHSDLWLLTDQRVGFYISLNSRGRGVAVEAIRSQIFRRFMDRYFPAAPTRRADRIHTAAADGRKIAGYYELSRRGQTTILALQRAAQQMRVVVDQQHDIAVPQLDMLVGSPPRTWREIAPMVWEDNQSSSRLAAVVKNGVVVGLTTDDLPALALLQPAPVSLSQGWLVPALGAAVLVMLVTVAGWTQSVLLKRRDRAKSRRHGLRTGLSLAVPLTAVANLVFLAGWAGVFFSITQDLTLAGPGLDAWFRGLQLVAALGIIGGLVALANLVRIWRDPASDWRSRIGNLVVVAAFAVAAWVTFGINVFAPSLNY